MPLIFFRRKREFSVKLTADGSLDKFKAMLFLPKALSRKKMIISRPSVILLE